MEASQLVIVDPDAIFYSMYMYLDNFQPLARFKVQKFAEVTKIVTPAPQTAAGECFYHLNK